MSNRTARRAAERQAQKSHSPQQSADLLKIGTAGLTPDLIAEIEERYPGYIEHRARVHAMLDAEATPEDEAQTTHATEAQITANQANSKLSTGPISPEGKATVSQNRLTHGLTGHFQRLPGEDAEAFHALTESVYSEYQPTTETEKRLAESLIHHYWRILRAIRLQDLVLLGGDQHTDADAKKLSLFLRYQITHERSYYKAQRELQNLQKQKQKEQIGFESQTQVQEAHEARGRLAHAKALNMEVNATCRQTIEAPLPGLTKIPLKEIIEACRTAVATLAYDEQFKTAA